jgi:hypothetical protein
VPVSSRYSFRPDEELAVDLAAQPTAGPLRRMNTDRYLRAACRWALNACEKWDTAGQI